MDGREFLNLGAKYKQDLEVLTFRGFRDVCKTIVLNIFGLSS